MAAKKVLSPNYEFKMAVTMEEAIEEFNRWSAAHSRWMRLKFVGGARQIEYIDSYTGKVCDEVKDD